MYGYYYFDPTYLLLVIGMVLSLLASAKVKSTFSVYSRVRSASGLTGADAARRILRMSGITDVTVVPISGSLTDHYDPGSKKLALSQDVYDKTSVAAIGVAAHECGHAIQHATNYVPLNLRSAIVPVANIGSTLSWPLFLAGLIFSIRPLLTVGIILFTFAVLFQLVTLPVEFNASSRALKMLGSSGMLGADEVKGARKVLTAAALTYVAALASSIRLKSVKSISASSLCPNTFNNLPPALSIRYLPLIKLFDLDSTCLIFGNILFGMTIEMTFLPINIISTLENTF